MRDLGIKNSGSCRYGFVGVFQRQLLSQAAISSTGESGLRDACHPPVTADHTQCRHDAARGTCECEEMLGHQ